MEISPRPLDLLVVVIYLAAITGIGLWMARRSRGTEEYFAGNRSFSGWVVGISMLGTVISSVTFLALPAAAYVLDWRQLSVNLVLPFVAVIAVVFFIPFFRRAGLVSAFEYLGDRFGPVARMYGTISFAVLQLVRVASVLFLVALPLQFLLNVPLSWVIVGAGVFIAIYTIAGGIESVLWTNAVQALIMLLGGVLCVTCILMDLPGGVGQVIEIGNSAEKFSLGSFDWNLHERTFWTVAILGVVNWLHIYSSEQTVVQRYVAARSTRDARIATILFSAVSIPMWTMFFFLGTALFVYYQVFPDPRMADLDPEQVLPYFVMTRVPAGLAGIVVAAVMAAAISSLDSGVNSIATVVVVDLVKPWLARGRDDRFYLRVARIVTTGVILLMIGGALLFTVIEKESINDVSLITTSILGGCLTGLYMLGFFTRRTTGRAVTVALVVATLVNIYLTLGLLGVLPLAWQAGVHSYWIGPIINIVFVMLAYGLSLLWRDASHNLSGLTVWTMPEKQGDHEASYSKSPQSL